MTTLVYGGENFAHIGAKFREKWLSHFDKDKWEENLQDAFAETTYAVSELMKPLYGVFTGARSMVDIVNALRENGAFQSFTLKPHLLHYTIMRHAIRQAEGCVSQVHGQAMRKRLYEASQPDTPLGILYYAGALLDKRIGRKLGKVAQYESRESTFWMPAILDSGLNVLEDKDIEISEELLRAYTAIGLKLWFSSSVVTLDTCVERAATIFGIPVLRRVQAVSHILSSYCESDEISYLQFMILARGVYELLRDRMSQDVELVFNDQNFFTTLDRGDADVESRITMRIPRIGDKQPFRGGGKQHVSHRYDMAYAKTSAIPWFHRGYYIGIRKAKEEGIPTIQIFRADTKGESPLLALGDHLVLAQAREDADGVLLGLNTSYPRESWETDGRAPRDARSLVAKFMGGLAVAINVMNRIEPMDGRRRLHQLGIQPTAHGRKREREESLSSEEEVEEMEPEETEEMEETEVTEEEEEEEGTTLEDEEKSLEEDPELSELSAMEVLDTLARRKAEVKTGTTAGAFAPGTWNGMEHHEHLQLSAEHALERFKIITYDVKNSGEVVVSESSHEIVHPTVTTIEEEEERPTTVKLSLGKYTATVDVTKVEEDTLVVDGRSVIFRQEDGTGLPFIVPDISTIIPEAKLSTAKNILLDYAVYKCTFGKTQFMGYSPIDFGYRKISAHAHTGALARTITYASGQNSPENAGNVFYELNRQTVNLLEGNTGSFLSRKEKKLLNSARDNRDEYAKLIPKIVEHTGNRIVPFINDYGSHYVTAYRYVWKEIAVGVAVSYVKPDGTECEDLLGKSILRSDGTVEMSPRQYNVPAGVSGIKVHVRVRSHYAQYSTSKRETVNVTRPSANVVYNVSIKPRSIRFSCRADFQ